MKTNSKLKKSINFFIFLLITCFMVISFSCKDTPPDDYTGDDQPSVENSGGDVNQDDSTSTGGNSASGDGGTTSGGNNT